LQVDEINEMVDISYSPIESEKANDSLNDHHSNTLPKKNNKNRPFTGRSPANTGSSVNKIKEARFKQFVAT